MNKQEVEKSLCNTCEHTCKQLGVVDKCAAYDKLSSPEKEQAGDNIGRCKACGNILQKEGCPVCHEPVCHEKEQAGDDETEIDIESICEKVHKAYCRYHLEQKGTEYWTKGDYSKLNEEGKEYDRRTVMAVLEAIGSHPPSPEKWSVDGVTVIGKPKSPQEPLSYRECEKIEGIIYSQLYGYLTTSQIKDFAIAIDRELSHQAGEGKAYEVCNKVCSYLFATRELAEKFILDSGATTATGLQVIERPIYGSHPTSPCGECENCDWRDLPKLRAEIKRYREALEDIASMAEIDQDDRYRLQDKAKTALETGKEAR